MLARRDHLHRPLHTLAPRRLFVEKSHHWIYYSMLIALSKQSTTWLVLEAQHWRQAHMNHQDPLGPLGESSS